jgi:hypothetical protein
MLIIPCGGIMGPEKPTDGERLEKEIQGLFEVGPDKEDEDDDAEEEEEKKK